jgi:hypothetical protein
MEQTNLNRNDVEGFYLEGAYVAGLKDKSFKIIELPFYMEFPGLDNREELKRKLVMKIELADGTKINYIPNKTSQKSIIIKMGYDLNRWVGFAGEFVIKEQKVGKLDKLVIYIKE